MQDIPQYAFWIVSAVLVEAAIIDGLKLRVPNWLTYHLVLSGLALAVWYGGVHGLLWSVAGLAVGLMVLMPLYAIGGMGAGDVKLMAGVGAWVGPVLTFWAFTTSAIVGGVMAVGMVLWTRSLEQHTAQFLSIGREILSVRNPVLLSGTAAERKPSMLLLPYGIPIAVGTIGYFAWMGLLF